MPHCPGRGEYTCVAQTPYMRKTLSTVLKVEGPALSGHQNCLSKRTVRGEAARIYMWTVSRLEYEHNTVQLFCRAYGIPQPTITWYDSLNNTLTDDLRISLASNGDLVIRDISWVTDMGLYRCEAHNPLGSHSVETFLYPTPRDDQFGLPV